MGKKTLLERAKIWMKQRRIIDFYTPLFFLIFLMNTCGSSHFLGQRELISDVFLGGVKRTRLGADVRLGRTSHHTWTLYFFVFIVYQNQAETLLCLFFFGCVLSYWFCCLFFCWEIVRQGSCNRCDKLFDHLKIWETQPTPWPDGRMDGCGSDFDGPKNIPSRSHNDEAKGTRVEVSLQKILWCPKLL